MNAQAGTKLTIGDRNGMVVIQFDHPVEEVTFPPEDARRMGEVLARSAYAAHTGRPAPEGQSQVTVQLRNRIVLSVTHIIRSLQEQGKLPAHIAEHVVDTVLAETT